MILFTGVFYFKRQLHTLNTENATGVCNMKLCFLIFVLTKCLVVEPEA